MRSDGYISYVFLLLLLTQVVTGNPIAAEGKKGKGKFSKAVTLYLKASGLRSEGKFADAIPVADKSLQEIALLNGEKTVLYAQVQTLYGELLLYTADPRKASGQLSSAVKIYATASESKQFDYARALGLLAQSLGDLSRQNEAEKYFTQAQKIYEQETGICSLDYASLLYAKGCMYYAQKRNPEAAKALQRAAQIWHANNVFSDRRVNDCFCKLCDCFLEMGRKNEAQTCLLLAVEAAYKAFGSDSEQYVKSLADLVAFYKKTGNKDLEKRYSRELVNTKTSRERQKKELEKQKACSKCLPKR